MEGRRGGAQVLEPAALGGADRHFSDAVSAAVLTHVARTAGVPAEQVLARAGDTRAPDDVASGAGWSDHGQFRALLRSAAAALGGPDALRGLGATMSFDNDDAHPYVDALHGLGSPAGLYRAVEELASLFMPAAVISVEVTGPTSCTVQMMLRPGLEPFPELCALVAGLLSLLPRPFGCDTAEVEHTACSCRGAASCAFEVTWSESGSPAVLRDIVQSRRRAERARLDGLLEALGTVAAGGTTERMLEQLVTSTERATHGLGIVLVLLPGAPSATTVFSSGVDPVRARAVATQLRGDGPGFGGPVVPVTGPRGRYGHLALVPHNGVLTKDQLEVAESYAQIAAAALDAAGPANVDQRDEGATWILELSATLAEATTVDDTAARIAAAAPDLLGCDQAVVAVRDRHLPIGRLAAVHGFPPEVTARVQRLVVPMFDTPGTEAAVQDATSSPRSELDRCMALGGSGAWVSLPLVADDHLSGVLVAGVTGDPERLEPARRGEEPTAALVRLAAVALRTAAGHEQSHHDALHDGLTGLGNRVLFLDRVALVVDRVRRDGTSGAVLVIDLDDFSATNDCLGRAAADVVLQTVAGRLALALRRTDSVSRLGADTFAAVLECASGSAATAAGRVLEVLRAPFPLDAGGPPLTMTASIGVARIEPGGQGDPAALLADAVEARRVARTAGGNRAVVHVLPSAPAG